MIRLFNAKRLAEELRQKKVSPRDRGYYLVAGFLTFTVCYYTGLVSGNPLWSPLAIYEGLAILVVTVVGFSNCYSAAGGDENPDFVVEFTCLYTPVSITTILAVWGVYWITVIFFRESIIKLSDSHLPLAESLIRYGSNFFGLLTVIAAVTVQAITFYRVMKLFQAMRE